jgi:hypothetical protein
MDILCYNMENAWISFELLAHVMKYVYTQE